MKRMALGLVPLGLLGTGCVSQARYDDLAHREKELSWRADAAEKLNQKLEAEKKVAQRETDCARDEARALREKLSLSGDALKEARREAAQQARREVDEELKARIAELQAKAPSKQELSPWGGVVLESGILFAPGRHELTKEGEAALGPLVESLTGPKYEGYTVELSGHTDADPLKATAKVYGDNHVLAANRANSVRRFLVAKGVPTGRIWLSAWGETRPLASDAIADGKAKNRRVEIRLHHTQGEVAGSAKPGSDTTRPASAPRAPTSPVSPSEEPRVPETEGSD